MRYLQTQMSINENEKILTWTQMCCVLCCVQTCWLADAFPADAVCGPVRVKVGVKDNQTTNTQVTAIMQDVGLRNYGEFNEPFFCNEVVLWAVDENGWALLACRSV